MENDAAACFDRIVTPLSSVACQRLGMPSSAEHTHAETLLRMQFSIKTGYGISSMTYGSSDEDPLQGQGQGSGNAPACWGATMTPMWTSLQSLSTSTFTASTPDSATAVSLQGTAFVDDSTLYTNDYHLPIPWTPLEAATDLERHAQIWEQLLVTTGGALRLDKCFWWLLHWDWTNPVQPKPTVHDHNLNITLTDHDKNTTSPVTHRSSDQAERTLGVRISPSGSNETELNHLYVKATNIATRLINHKITRKAAWTAYRSILA